MFVYGTWRLHGIRGAPTSRPETDSQISWCPAFCAYSRMPFKVTNNPTEERYWQEAPNTASTTT